MIDWMSLLSLESMATSFRLGLLYAQSLFFLYKSLCKKCRFSQDFSKNKKKIKSTLYFIWRIDFSSFLCVYVFVLFFW